MGRFKRTTPAPNVFGTGYGRFRHHVRMDFERCCAYCYMHEDHMGGVDQYEIDHFYPQSSFRDKINEYDNLYWCCHRCNRLKHDAWPSPEVIAQGGGFVDLCAETFEDHFHILPDGELKPLTEKANYTIRQVGLNQDHLKRLRVRLLSQGQRMDAAFAMPLFPDV